MVVKGPSVTPGYVDEAANRGILLPDGWFNSGDLGRFDADGYLWITGRAKDIIIRGGHNIHPAHIEELATRHPAVQRAAAVPMKDARLGERVCLAVVTRAGTDGLASTRHTTLVLSCSPKSTAIGEPL